MSSKISNLVGLSIFVVASVTLGCGGGSESYVSGKVTLDGNPVGPGRVTFISNSQDKTPSFGGLDTNGNYKLYTDKKLGLPAGEYLASVVALEVPDTDPNERQMTPSKSLIPAKYNSSKTSLLSYEVKKGSNRIDIQLTSD